MQSRAYSKLLRYARQVSKRADEAEDLLQSVLLAAVEAERADMACADNCRWLFGALRKRALFDARSAIRRRRRETSVAFAENATNERESVSAHFILSLPPGLRTTALLALSGHTKAEIAWLLRLSDCALRQRINGIKRRWRGYNGHNFPEMPGLSGTLQFGQIRRALHKPVRHSGALLASHDPDGNLFILSSQKREARQQEHISTQKQE